MSYLFGFDTEADMVKSLARNLMDREVEQWRRGGVNQGEVAESYIDLVEKVVASLDEQAATTAYAVIVEAMLGGEVPLSEAEAQAVEGNHRAAADVTRGF